MKRSGMTNPPPKVGDDLEISGMIGQITKVTPTRVQYEGVAGPMMFRGSELRRNLRSYGRNNHYWIAPGE